MPIEVLETVFFFRGMERLLIQVGGLMSIGLGVLLFRWGVQGATDVEGKGLGFDLKVKNAAPGTMLALFGMVILVAGIGQPATVDQQLIDGWNKVRQAPSANLGPSSLPPAPPFTSENEPGSASPEPTPTVSTPPKTEDTTPPHPTARVKITYADTRNKFVDFAQRLKAARGGEGAKERLAEFAAEARSFSRQGLDTKQSALLGDVVKQSSNAGDDEAADEALKKLRTKAKALVK